MSNPQRDRETRALKRAQRAEAALARMRVIVETVAKADPHTPIGEVKVPGMSMPKRLQVAAMSVLQCVEA